jgi:hypothetical protein
MREDACNRFFECFMDLFIICPEKARERLSFGIRQEDFVELRLLGSATKWPISTPSIFALRVSTSKPSYLYKSGFQRVYGRDFCRVRDRHHIRPKADEITILLVQLLVDFVRTLREYP